MRTYHQPVPAWIRVLGRAWMAEGGVSHWRAFEDNWLIGKMHTRLMWRRMMHLLFRRPLALPA